MANKAVTFDEASDLLARAFQRLETAIATRASAAPDEAARAEIMASLQASLQKEMDALSDENLQLREENIALSNKLQALQEDYIDLQRQNEQIALRIDQQVEQLELIAQ